MIRTLSRLRNALKSTPIKQSRFYGFVPFSQDAIASERDTAASDVDSTLIGWKPPVKSSFVIPLGERPELRLKYENIYGGVRLGVLLEGNNARFCAINVQITSSQILTPLLAESLTNIAMVSTKSDR
jgi:hypothetical protein